MASVEIVHFNEFGDNPQETINNMTDEEIEEAITIIEGRIIALAEESISTLKTNLKV
jgi:hypothetical protein